MSRSPSTAKIGMFIFSSILLIVAAIVLLSSGSFFSKKANFVVFFNTSLKGLDVGAPVKFNGVKVGIVADISVAYDPEKKAVYTPVIIQIDSRMFDKMNISGMHIGDFQSFYDEQIKNGLAAKLTMDSVVTGKIFIELNYFKKNEIVTVKNLSGKYHQMPSVSQDFSEIITNIDSVIQKINTVDFKLVFDSLSKAGLSVADVFSDPNVKEILRSLNTTIGNFNTFVVHADGVLSNLDDNVKVAVKSFRESVDSMHNTSDTINDMFDPNSDFRTGLDHAVEQMDKTFRSVRVFVDYLERNPNALLTGKSL